MKVNTKNKSEWSTFSPVSCLIFILFTVTIYFFRSNIFGGDIEKKLIILLAYIFPVSIYLIVKFKNVINFILFYFCVSIYQAAIYSYFSERWAYGLFWEQDTSLFLPYLDNMSFFPWQNWADFSNGAVYISFIKFVNVYSFLSPNHSALAVNIMSLSLLMYVFYNSSIFSKKTKFISLKILAISPLIHSYLFICLKDIMMMSTFGVAFILLLEGKNKVYLIGLSIITFGNRIFNGFFLGLMVFPWLSVFLGPIALYVLLRGDLFWIINKLNQGIGDNGIFGVFPFSIIKFILTPLPFSASDYYPAKFPIVFHIPLTLTGFLAFLYYAKRGSWFFLYFFILLIITGHYAPEYDRFRLFFEPMFAVSLGLFLSKHKFRL